VVGDAAYCSTAECDAAWNACVQAESGPRPDAALGPSACVQAEKWRHSPWPVNQGRGESPPTRSQQAILWPLFPVHVASGSLCGRPTDVACTGWQVEI
jgi:hypothetical protein